MQCLVEGEPAEHALAQPHPTTAGPPHFLDSDRVTPSLATAEAHARVFPPALGLTTRAGAWLGESPGTARSVAPAPVAVGLCQLR